MQQNRTLILEDSSQCGFGGGQRFSLEIFNSLEASQHDVWLLDSIKAAWHQRLNRAKEKVSALQLEHLNYHSIRFNLLMFKRTLSIIGKVRPSTLYVTTNKHFIAASLYKLRNPRVQIIYHAHLLRSENLLWYLFDTLIIMIAKSIIFPSQFALDDFLSNRKLLQHQRLYISPFPPAQWSAPLEQKQLPLIPFTVGFVGRISSEKGVFSLLEGLEYLRSDRNWKFIFAGKGQDEDELRRRIRLSKHTRAIEYLGQAVTNLDFYLQFSLIVIPSFKHKESLCLGAIEALQAGIPLLVAENAILTQFVDEKSVFGLKTSESQHISSQLEKVRSIIEQRGGNRLFEHPMLKDNKSAFSLFYRNMICNEVTSASICQKGSGILS